eukprot:COSAG01_NODE_7591_length_3135_cov_2.998353_2_plen_85_part_00
MTAHYILLITRDITRDTQVLPQNYRLCAPSPPGQVWLLRPRLRPRLRLRLRLWLTDWLQRPARTDAARTIRLWLRLRRRGLGPD